MQKIKPFIWFEDKAEEAVRFYASLFPNAKIEGITDISDEAPGPKGQKVFNFTLEGLEFMAINGGALPGFTPSQAISFLVNCDSQEEIDRLWEKLGEGGKIMQCGWLTDRYGVTWQIAPRILGELMNNPDPEVVKRVTMAMLQMVKMDIAGLQAAAKG